MADTYDDFPDNEIDEEDIEDDLEDLEDEEEQENFDDEDESDILNLKETYDTLVENTEKQTPPYLTKFEKARVLGIRARQLSKGALPLVNTDGLEIPEDIALKELMERKLPFIIRRPLPNGKYENWKLEELRFE